MKLHLLSLSVLGTFLLTVSFAVTYPSLATAEMQMNMNDAVPMATSGIFTGTGKVISMMPAIKKIVISHGEIKGYMKAMPMGMGYAVSSTDFLKKVKAGDMVMFKLDAAEKKIVSIEAMQPGS